MTKVGGLPDCQGLVRGTDLHQQHEPLCKREFLLGGSVLQEQQLEGSHEGYYGGDVPKTQGCYVMEFSNTEKFWDYSARLV